MKTGFVILNFNSWKLTQKLACKMAALKVIDKVVIVDNASTDTSLDHLVLLESVKISVLQSKKNGGYSHGNNIGARYCADNGFNILFISNPDVDVEEEDITEILDCFQNSDYSLLSGVEYNENGVMKFPPIWKLNSYKDDLIQCFYLGRMFSKFHKGITLKKEEKIQEADIIKGSFFAVRLSDLTAVHYFDEATFLYCEERILSWKLKDARKKIGIVTSAKYRHNHSSSINKTYKVKTEQIKLLYKSRLYYNKHYNKIGLFKTMILWLAMRISVIEYRFVDIITYFQSNIVNRWEKRK